MRISEILYNRIHRLLSKGIVVDFFDEIVGVRERKLSFYADPKPTASGQVIMSMGVKCAERHLASIMWSLLLVALLTFVPAVLGEEVDAPTTNILQIQLYFRDGYAQANPMNFLLTPEFLQLSRTSSNAVRTELMDWLNGELKKQGRAFNYLRGATSATQPVIPADRQAEADFLTHLTTNWSAASGIFYKKWQDGSPIVKSNFLMFFSQRIAFPFAEANNQTSPLTVDPDDSDACKADDGQITFELRNPIPPSYARPTNVLFRSNADQLKQAGVSQENLADLLKSEMNRLWWSARLHRNLDDFFDRMGYDVAEPKDASTSMGLELHPPGEGEELDANDDPVPVPGVIIDGSPRLQAIQLGVDTNDMAGALRALYMVLPHEDYLRVRAKPDEFLQRFKLGWSSTDSNGNTIDLYGLSVQLTNSPGNTLSISAWFINRVELQDRLQALNVIQFGARLMGQETDLNNVKWVDLYIAPLAGDKGVKSTNSSGSITANSVSAPDTQGTNFHGLTDTVLLPASRDTNVFRRAADPPAGITADSEPRRRQADPNYHHSIEGGVSFASRQDPLFYAGYRQFGVPTNQAFGVNVGVQNKPLGSLDYTRDFLAFDTLERRWTVSATGFSDYDPNRFFNNVETTERRNGGNATSQLELFRDWQHHWMRLDMSGGWREIEDHPQNGPSAVNHVADGDVGLLYFWRKDGTKLSPNVSLEPHIHGGWSDTNNSYFAVMGGRAGGHLLLPSYCQLDIRANGNWSTAGTPITEQPSFGGGESVRGYSADAGVGRAAWAVQNELWLPLRHDWGWGVGVDRFVRRNILLAAFVDFGGVYGTGDNFSGFKAGAGGGLRIVWQDNLVIRLDCGQALTGYANGRGGTFFYFSATTKHSVF